jgi:hypothetical protein
VVEARHGFVVAGDRLAVDDRSVNAGRREAANADDQLLGCEPNGSIVPDKCFWTRSKVVLYIRTMFSYSELVSCALY